MLFSLQRALSSPFEAVQELDPELKNSLLSPIDWPHHLKQRDNQK